MLNNINGQKSTVNVHYRRNLKTIWQVYFVAKSYDSKEEPSTSLHKLPISVFLLYNLLT